MKNAFSVILGLALSGSLIPASDAVEAYSDPSGVCTLTLVGRADNVMSVPMVRDAVFEGSVKTVGANAMTVLSGQVSPGWTAAQFQYRDAQQPKTYYAEFTSGALKGLFYKIDNNGADTLTLDTEGDALNAAHSLAGNPQGALAAGDTFQIRPYWRIKDLLEENGAPLIEARPSMTVLKDDIFIPNYSTVGINKAPSLTVYYLANQGWRADGQGSTDFGNYILRPNEGFTVRRRNTAKVVLSNIGGVLMNKSISFIAGGSATSANDVYFSISRPMPVSLNQSGLYTGDSTTSVIAASPTTKKITDMVMEYSDAAGYNKSPVARYYYLAGKGWMKVGSSVANVGDTVQLVPGKSYIIRKTAGNTGRDWVNVANY